MRRRSRSDTVRRDGRPPRWSGLAQPGARPAGHELPADYPIPTGGAVATGMSKYRQSAATHRTGGKDRAAEWRFSTMRCLVRRNCFFTKHLQIPRTQLLYGPKTNNSASIHPDEGHAAGGRGVPDARRPLHRPSIAVQQSPKRRSTRPAPSNNPSKRPTISPGAVQQHRRNPSNNAPRGCPTTPTSRRPTTRREVVQQPQRGRRTTRGAGGTTAV